MGVMVADATFGEAVGGAVTGSVLRLASGQIVLRKGDQIIGVLDQATGRPVQLTMTVFKRYALRFPCIECDCSCHTFRVTHRRPCYT